MTRYILTGLAALALTTATFAAGGNDKKPATQPAPQTKKCCVDSKGHYRADWSNGVNCPHNHKYCK